MQRNARTVQAHNTDAKGVLGRMVAMSRRGDKPHKSAMYALSLHAHGVVEVIVVLVCV